MIRTCASGAVASAATPKRTFVPPISATSKLIPLCFTLMQQPSVNGQVTWPKPNHLATARTPKATGLCLVAIMFRLHNTVFTLPTSIARHIQIGHLQMAIVPIPAGRQFPRQNRTACSYQMQIPYPCRAWLPFPHEVVP